MKKMMMAGVLFTLLVSLGACCWPGYWHGGHGPGWNHRYDNRYEYQDRYRGEYHRYR